MAGGTGSPRDMHPEPPGEPHTGSPDEPRSQPPIRSRGQHTPSSPHYKVPEFLRSPSRQHGGASSGRIGLVNGSGRQHDRNAKSFESASAKASRTSSHAASSEDSPRHLQSPHVRLSGGPQLRRIVSVGEEEDAPHAPRNPHAPRTPPAPRPPHAPRTSLRSASGGGAHGGDDGACEGESGSEAEVARGRKVEGEGDIPVSELPRGNKNATAAGRKKFELTIEVPPPPLKEWTVGLFSCFQDVSLCVGTCLCPCLTSARIAHALGEHSCPDSDDVVSDDVNGDVSRGRAGQCCAATLYLALCFVLSCQLYSARLRWRLRQRFGLTAGCCCSGCCGDVLTHCCCGLCALCQEHRELQAHGIDPFTGASIFRSAPRVTPVDDDIGKKEKDDNSLPKQECPASKMGMAAGAAAAAAAAVAAAALQQPSNLVRGLAADARSPPGYQMMDSDSELS